METIDTLFNNMKLEDRILVNGKYECIVKSLLSPEVKNDNCNSYESKFDVEIHHENESIHGYILRLDNKDLPYCLKSYDLVLFDNATNSISAIITIVNATTI